jgi:ssDNA-binding Zn-finger/Zn-ribbon topoisomerase 1
MVVKRGHFTWFVGHRNYPQCGGTRPDEKLPSYQLDPHHPGAIAYDVLADWLIAYNHENA